MSQVHNEERHPNGTPKTIHHWDERTKKPVFHHEVVPMDLEELVKLGHPRSEAVEMVKEAKKNSKGASAGAE